MHLFMGARANSLKLTVLAIALTLQSPVAQAQPRPATILVQTFDTVTRIAPPPWQTELLPQSESQISQKRGRGSNGGQYLVMEFVPKGQTLRSWNRLYAMKAETNLPRRLKDYRRGVVQSFANSCKRSTQEVLIDTKEQQLFYVYCGAYKNVPREGEIMLMSMRKSGRTLVKNYIHWRGRRFDPFNRGTFPVGPKELAKGMRSLERFSVEGRN